MSCKKNFHTVLFLFDRHQYIGLFIYVGPIYFILFYFIYYYYYFYNNTKIVCICKLWLLKLTLIWILLEMDFNYIVICCYYKLKADGIIRVIIDFMIRPFSFHDKNGGLSEALLVLHLELMGQNLHYFQEFKILQEGYFFFLIQEKKK